MLTQEQIDNAREFHAGECSCTVGPRGGITVKREVWRRNGKTQRWKRTPERFRVPIKHGLYDCGRIDPINVRLFHAAEDCPLNKEGGR